VTVRLSDAQRRQVFGAPCVTRNLVTVVTPWGMRVQAHHLVAERFLYACRTAHQIARWTPRRVDSYACRTIRGSTAMSLHSYGLAWDWFNLALPQPVDVWGPVNAPDRDFRAVFKQAGFSLGSEFTSRQDYPHIEWAGGLPPASPTATGIVPLELAVPLVRPITYTRFGEATGMQISTHFVDIPALDKDGRGWVDIPVPLERVVSVTGHGSSPADDGYWPPVTVDVQPRGAATRVTLTGGAGARCGFWWKCLEA